MVRTHRRQSIRKSRTQVKREYQVRLIRQGTEMRTDHETSIELQLPAAVFPFWHAVIGDAFTAALQSQLGNPMDTLSNIEAFDELLCELEEIMEYSPNGGSINLTINQLHKLMSATATHKLRYLFNEPNIEMYRFAEEQESELKRLALPYKKELDALDKVIGIAH